MSEKIKKANPWLVCSIAILVGVALATSKYKVSNTTTLLMADLGMSYGDVGYLTSVLTVFGVILAIPAGGIMMRFGAKRLIIAAVIAELVGNLIGCVASGYSVLLAGRFIEGIAFGLLPVAAPALISANFPPEKRGLPMSIWSLYNGLGMLVMARATPLLVNADVASSWVNAWYFNVAFFVALLLLCIFCVKDPQSEAKGDKPEVEKAKAGGKAFWKALLSPTTWLASLCFTIFCVGVNACCAFAPAYAQNVLGMTLADANGAFSLFSIGNIVGGIAIGIVLNKVRNRHIWLAIGMAATTLACVWMFNFTADTAVVFFFVGGILFQLYPAVAFAVCPETALSPATVGVALGIMTIMQRIGTYFTGPVGSLIDAGGFQLAGAVCIGIGCLGIVLAVACIVLLKRKQASEVAVVAVDE